jgi:hypothetical protein
MRDNGIAEFGALDYRVAGDRPMRDQANPPSNKLTKPHPNPARRSEVSKLRMVIATVAEKTVTAPTATKSYSTLVCIGCAAGL